MIRENGVDRQTASSPMDDSLTVPSAVLLRKGWRVCIRTWSVSSLGAANRVTVTRLYRILIEKRDRACRGVDWPRWPRNWSGSIPFQEKRIATIHWDFAQGFGELAHQRHGADKFFHVSGSGEKLLSVVYMSLWLKIKWSKIQRCWGSRYESSIGTPTITTFRLFAIRD